MLTNCSFGLGRNVATIRSSITLMLDPVSSIIVRWVFSILTLVGRNLISGLASLSVYTYSRSLSVCTYCQQLLSLIFPRCRFVYAHTFLTFLSNWSRDRIHPINGLDSSCKPHVTRAYQSVVWKLLEWKHVSHVSSSTGMVCTTVWTFLRAGKLYITDRRGPSMNVSYFHYRSGLVFTRTHTYPHAHRHTSNPRYRTVYKS